MINSTHMVGDELSRALDFEANRADSVRDPQAERVAAEGGIISSESAAEIRNLFRSDPNDPLSADI